MLTPRKANERGHADHGWLNALHSFSFANYYDPAHMGFSALRVINEDRIAPNMGFGTHGHQNMEIITYVLEGELAHKDSMGNASTIRAGEVQKMSAGRGVRHSEFNPDEARATHLLQIWIEPNVANIEPEYEQNQIADLPLLNGWRAVAAPDGVWNELQGAVRLYQDGVLLLAHHDDGLATRSHALAHGRAAYVHIATGSALVNGLELQAGDALKINDEAEVSVQLQADAQVLLFDLPHVIDK